MTDAELLLEYLNRENRWLQTLQALRAFHETSLGRTTTGIQWIGGRELGRLSWLGFYWPQEVFWFGYGLHHGLWQPLIEADTRSAFSGVLESLQEQLSDTWESVVKEGTLYRRLWAGGLLPQPNADADWFRARSRELHEFVVQPEV